MESNDHHQEAGVMIYGSLKELVAGSGISGLSETSLLALWTDFADLYCASSLIYSESYAAHFIRWIKSDGDEWTDVGDCTTVSENDKEKMKRVVMEEAKEFCDAIDCVDDAQPLDFTVTKDGVKLRIEAEIE
jgi:hypothetical protein